jgi:hypothetical protein
VKIAEEWYCECNNRHNAVNECFAKVKDYEKINAYIEGDSKQALINKVIDKTTDKALERYPEIVQKIIKTSLNGARDIQDRAMRELDFSLKSIEQAGASAQAGIPAPQPKPTVASAKQLPTAQSSLSQRLLGAWVETFGGAAPKYSSIIQFLPDGSFERDTRLIADSAYDAGNIRVRTLLVGRYREENGKVVVDHLQEDWTFADGQKTGMGSNCCGGFFIEVDLVDDTLTTDWAGTKAGSHMYVKRRQ